MFGKYGIEDYKSLMEQRDSGVLEKMGGVKGIMEELKTDHELIVTLEDGVLDGGFGEKITRYFGCSPIKVLNFGAPKEFADRFDPQTFLKQNHLTAPQIAEDILQHLS